MGNQKNIPMTPMLLPILFGVLMPVLIALVYYTLTKDAHNRLDEWVKKESRSVSQVEEKGVEWLGSPVIAENTGSNQITTTYNIESHLIGFRADGVVVWMRKEN